MNYFLRIFILVVLVVGVNMILFNVFHVKDYVALSVGVAIAVLAATYEIKRK